MAVKYAGGVLVVVLGLLAPLVSLAEEVGPAGKLITAGDLADLQAEIVFAQAQARLAEEKRKVSPVVDGVDLAQQSAGTALPVVTGVFGRGQQLYASFLYSNGLDWQAKAGMTAPGGYLVRSISQDRVLLTKAGRTYVLGFSDVRPAEPVGKEANEPAFSPTASSPFLPIPTSGRK